MIRSNHFKWWTAILEKALNPLRAEAQVLQIWSIQSSSCIFSQTTAYFKIKIHWDVCPIITNNLKGNVKFLAISKWFFENFLKLLFSSWNLWSLGSYIIPKVHFWYKTTITRSKNICFACFFSFLTKKCSTLKNNLHILLIYHKGSHSFGLTL